MIKKILALAATALFSMNASAGYIQYNLTGGLVDYTGRGTIIMDDTDKSIVFYQMTGFHLAERGSPVQYSTLISATTSFTGMGPTNMLVRDEDVENGIVTGRIIFSADPNNAALFNYAAHLTFDPGRYEHWPAGYSIAPRDVFGTAFQVPLEQQLLDDLKYYSPVNHIVPYFDATQVPEPASLALFAIGALGAAGIARRHKKAA
jgi:hypothetical protein